MHANPATTHAIAVLTADYARDFRARKKGKTLMVTAGVEVGMSGNETVIETNTTVTQARERGKNTTHATAVRTDERQA